MKLSICIPTYNRSYYLMRLLNNIYEQYSETVEVVVVNDGSTDNTNNVVESFYDKINVSLHNQVNLGRATALKKAINSSSCEFTLLMDDEDLFVKGGLNLILESLELLSSNKNQNQNLSGIVFLTQDIHNSIIGSQFPYSPMISNLVKINADFKVRGDKKQVIRTDLLKEVMYDNPLNERRVPTYVLWSRIAKFNNTLFLNKIVVQKDYLEDGMTNNISVLRKQSCDSSRMFYKEIAELSTKIYKSKLYRLKHVILFHKYNFYCTNNLQCKAHLIYNLTGFTVGFLLYFFESNKL